LPSRKNAQAAHPHGGKMERWVSTKGHEQITTVILSKNIATSINRIGLTPT